MTASAWATFIDAGAAAKAQNKNDWATTAKNRAADLQKKLSRLTLKVVAKGEGLEVRRDGVVIQEASFGTATPVDPGKHEIEATAAKKKKFSVTVYVKPNGDKVEVVVPDLDERRRSGPRCRRSFLSMYQPSIWRNRWSRGHMITR